MNVWEEITTNNAVCANLEEKMAQIKTNAEKKAREIKEQRWNEERALRDKWDDIERKHEEDYESNYKPLKEQARGLYNINDGLMDNIFIARVGQQGQRAKGYGVPLNFFTIEIRIEPPAGQRKKYELNIEIRSDYLENKLHEQLRSNGTYSGYSRKVLERRFDTLDELNGYFERNRDKILAPLYAEDLRLTKIAADPDYLKIVTSEFDMKIAWGYGWSGERCKASKHSVISQYDGYEVKLRFLKEDRFKITAKKMNDEPLTDEDREKIVDHVKNHLQKESIFYVRCPELIWE